MQLTGRTVCQGLACVVLLAVPALPIQAQLSISGVGKLDNPSGMNAGLSGLCYAGGTQFYAVDDSGGVMQPATISVSPASGAITAASFASALTLGGADLEGIAYNPARNSVLVSDETGATIKEYTLTGTLRSSVNVPTVLTSYRSNFSLESLTVRGDGLEMWTCNEEALYNAGTGVNDGPLSTPSAGSVVRLQRFSRSNVNGVWAASGQWAYLTEPYGKDSSLTEAERSGVSDLCVLPDGTLLVLERTLGYATFFVPTFENRIYKVDFTGATDTSAITSLAGATYTRVTKTKLWSNNFSVSYNFEGLCLGPRLDGEATSLLMIADGDDLSNALYSLKLTGLTSRQLTVSRPYGPADPVTGTYRYLYGQTVTNSVISPLTTGTTTQTVCTGWVLTGGDAPASGSTPTMTMTVMNDGVLTWQWSGPNYWLDTGVSGNGSVTPGDGWYTEGASVTVTAVPSQWHRFAGWIGHVPAGHENDNPLTVTMSQARQLTATFREISRRTVILLQ